jgi:DNA-binding MarR family transcriptional regulator
VPNSNALDLEAAGSWAKKYFFASRAFMESVLHPYDLGTTQWYVIYLLANDGPINQRELTRTLEVERATLSAVIGALVRKGLVEQMSDPDDKRQKVLQLTTVGRNLWATLPDPIGLIAEVAFAGVDDAEIALTNRVLRDATQRLNDYKEENNSI